MYKAVVALYIICFSAYVLFSRVPDYFDGDFIHGIVKAASSNSKQVASALEIEYHVGSEVLIYKTDMWFLRTYKVGERVSMIYNPDNPEIASIYALIGYWVRWPELLFTAGFFIVLFFVAKDITGTNSNEPLTEAELAKKRKYKD